LSRGFAHVKPKRYGTAPKRQGHRPSSAPAPAPARAPTRAPAAAAASPASCSSGDGHENDGESDGEGEGASAGARFASGTATGMESNPVSTLLSLESKKASRQPIDLKHAFPLSFSSSRFFSRRRRCCRRRHCRSLVTFFRICGKKPQHYGLARRSLALLDAVQWRDGSYSELLCALTVAANRRNRQ